MIAIYRYFMMTQDMQFLLQVLPSIERGLNWIISYGDKDKDYLVEYELPKERKHGGLVVQSWTDSVESMLQEDGKLPLYPIAPVEVHGYVWLALNLWADFYGAENHYANTEAFSQKLRSQAGHMKESFNRVFLFEDETAQNMIYAAQALDGEKHQIKTVTGNPLLLLWSSYDRDGVPETILESQSVESIIKRSFLDDMFDEHCGIRTMSMRSRFYNPNQNSYHNGSFWPKLNGMAHEGLVKWGYKQEAARLRNAALYALNYFGTPIELYIKAEDGRLLEYVNGHGQASCREQAWSAAAMLDLSLHDESI